MANIMSDYWVNFARTGNPNGEGLPEWQPYTRTNPDYIELNVTATPASNITPEVWDFFDQVIERQRQQ